MKIHNVLRKLIFKGNNLKRDDLQGTKFTEKVPDLRGANLAVADFTGIEANLQKGVDLRGADLKGANLYEEED